jgi:hypothetical protein
VIDIPTPAAVRRGQRRDYRPGEEPGRPAEMLGQSPGAKRPLVVAHPEPNELGHGRVPAATWLESFHAEAGTLAESPQPEAREALIVVGGFVLGPNHRGGQEHQPARTADPGAFGHQARWVGYVLENFGAKDCVVCSIGQWPRGGIQVPADCVVEFRSVYARPPIDPGVAQPSFLDPASIRLRPAPDVQEVTPRLPSSAGLRHGQGDPSARQAAVDVARGQAFEAKILRQLALRNNRPRRSTQRQLPQRTPAKSTRDGLIKDTACPFPPVRPHHQLVGSLHLVGSWV